MEVWRGLMLMSLWSWSQPFAKALQSFSSGRICVPPCFVQPQNVSTHAIGCDDISCCGHETFLRSRIATILINSRGKGLPQKIHQNEGIATKRNMCIKNYESLGVTIGHKNNRVLFCFLPFCLQLYLYFEEIRKNKYFNHQILIIWNVGLCSLQ